MSSCAFFHAIYTFDITKITFTLAFHLANDFEMNLKKTAVKPPNNECKQLVSFIPKKTPKMCPNFVH